MGYVPYFLSVFILLIMVFLKPCYDKEMINDNQLGSYNAEMVYYSCNTDSIFVNLSERNILNTLFSCRGATCGIWFGNSSFVYIFLLLSIYLCSHFACLFPASFRQLWFEALTSEQSLLCQLLTSFLISFL